MDAIPPVLVASVPAADSVRVQTDRVELAFSERLDVASVTSALSIAPGFDAPLDVRANGSRITVLFPDSLQPQTTYVLTLGSSLKDERGVALPRPITLAFSTGDRLDRGRLTGQARDPRTGQGSPRLAVAAFRLPDAWAQALPDSLGATTDSLLAVLSAPDGPLPDPREPQALVYRTETDTEGAFRLDYLRPGPYFVMVFEDRNRNRRVDDGERTGVPSWPVALATDDSTATALPDVFVAASDSTAPALRRVRTLTASQHGFVFDEAIQLGPGRTEGWLLTDSLGTDTLDVRAVWNTPERPQDVLVQTPPLSPGTYRLVLSGNQAVADSSGNAAVLDTYFSPSAAADTAAVRFEGFLPASRSAADSVLLLRPDQRPGVRFTQPLDATALRDRVTLSGPDGPLPIDARSDDGLLIRLLPPDGVRTFRLDVTEPDSVYTRRYAYPTADALGAVLGQVPNGDGPILVTLYPTDGEPLHATTGADGRFAFRALPAGEYRLRLVIDRNGNGRWDGGRLVPFAPPEPIRWLEEPVRVRARWDTELESDQLVIGTPGD